MTVKGGFMLGVTTIAIGCIFGCTQSALPISSTMIRHQSLNDSTIGNSYSNNQSIVIESTAPYTNTMTNVPVVNLPVSNSAPMQLAQVTYRNQSNPWKPGVAARDWKFMVLHHTAADKGSVESIHEAHLQRRDSAGNPWLGIGYHFVIGNGKGMADGQIEPTFRWRQQLHGAHAGKASHNQQGIGICLVGNFEEYPPTKAQLASTKRLVRQLRNAYGIQATNIVGHGDVKQTACPGRFFAVNKVTQGPSVFSELASRSAYGDSSSQGSASVTLAAQEFNAR